jgi:pantetheine-phosphate adenylyltransferase
MRRAIFPGSFDPLTNGHLDIIRRCSPLFDEIVIAILNNPEKKPLFSVKERREMIREILGSTETDCCRLIVDSFSGLTADFAHEKSAAAIIRGIRAIGDYEYELRMALMNRRLQPAIETVFLTAAEEYSFVSSTLMKQVFELGGRVDGLVPDAIIAKMRIKLGNGGDVK